MQIFVDMDGVLADFDQHHEDVFGERACKVKENVDWEKVRAIPNFYAGIPPMKDMWELWNYVCDVSINEFGTRPIVLTGIPSSVEEAERNKRGWILNWLGPAVEVRCCLSKEKALHCKPGDILIDDWTKYKHLWVAEGGYFIVHTSAADTIKQMKQLLSIVRP